MPEINDFSSIRISLASPATILAWSHGEVTKPETIDYRTLKPVRDGIFCERIFGPTRDWECYCGKYKRVRFRGVVCDVCGVTLTRSKVRRERMAHIQLATPVSHIWYVKGSPSHLSLLLDITPRNLERVLYFAAYIVTHVDDEARTEIRDELEAMYDDRIASLELEFEDKQGVVAIGLTADLQRISNTPELEVEKQSTSPSANTLQARFVALRKAFPFAFIHYDGQRMPILQCVEELSTLREQIIDETIKENLESLKANICVGQAITEEFITNCVIAYNNPDITKWWLQSFSPTPISTNDFDNILSYIDAQKRLLKQDYEKLREDLENHYEEIVDEEIVFRSVVLVSEGRRISEKTIDHLDERYARELAVFDAQSSSFARKQPVRDQHNRIKEQFDREKVLLLKEKKKSLDMLDAIRLKRVLSESDYRDLCEIAPKSTGVFKAEMGASAIRGLIERTVDLDTLAVQLQYEISSSNNSPKRKKLIKRLRVFEAFRKSGNKPEWMIMTVLPVIPPDLRPMVQLDGGRFATSDLNDLYRRVINRNNRLKRLMELNAPDIIVRNEKRMLQEAVDALIDNGRRGRAVSGKGLYRLKSLSDMFKGKQGRFRQNLLGKRVDYSGRSVIVVGPNLKLHQCGLPKKMALELFKPFVMQRLFAYGVVSNVKAAKKLVERVKPEVWDVLEEVIKEYLVLLNRAPSLHRLSIQAFEVNLIEGSAIQLHPLVCAAFNVDFDGDQMTVHVPLSKKAQEEARLRMLSTYNIFSPATGDPTITPSQDIVLGCFYLTIVRDGAKGAGRIFVDIDEALLAFDNGVVDIQAPIWVRMRGVKFNGEKNDRYVRHLIPDVDGTPRMLLETTVGRLIFNRELLPPLQYRNHEVGKGDIKNIILDCYKWYTTPENLSEENLDTIRAMYPSRQFSNEELLRYYGSERTAEQADKIKSVGFHYATLGGMTIGVQDIKVPDDKIDIMQHAEAQRTAAKKRFNRGLTTDKERYNQVVQIWTKASKTMMGLVRKANDAQPFNPVSMMVRSNARGNINQLTQMAGMRGLMADPTGKIIELPIKSNFREGLTVLEYFVSTHGDRKGLVDTALRTADAGYLTRRLIDVAQDNIVITDDCGSNDSLLLHAHDNDDESMDWKMPSRAVGRIAAQDIIAKDGTILVTAGDEVREEVAAQFYARGVTRVFIRTPLHCHAEYGICRMCYGRDLTTGNLVALGEAVGIIAAQSIGEPGTQLTLRTFHTGGVASADDVTQGLSRIIEIFEARINPETRAIIAEHDGIMTRSKDGWIYQQQYLHIVDEGNVYDEQIMPDYFVATVARGAMVNKDDIIARSNNAQIREQALRARHHGVVNIWGRVIHIISNYYDVTDTPIPQNARLRKGVYEGDRVVAGQLLTEGSAHPQDLLEIQGRDALQTYMLKEAQKVYRPQGVYINDKHIEIILRQMLRRVRISEAGDTHYLPGERVDISEFARVNTEIWAQGGIPAIASSLLLGITKASLETDSFLSAASFQETTRVLTNAAIEGKVDYLRGLKENVAIGKLIPAGTGAEARRQVAAAELAAELAEDDERNDEDSEYEPLDVRSDGWTNIDREKRTPTYTSRQRTTPTIMPIDADVLAMLESLKSYVDDESE
jgi:DNA-directed RNA polymerase subunit beta'